MKTLNFKKHKELRKLKDYLANLNKNRNNFPDGYWESKKVLIDRIEWLIASYEGRAGDPKELLEVMLSPIGCKHPEWIEDITFLYYWIYYKNITGF
jgi:hypothetical protein